MYIKAFLSCLLFVSTGCFANNYGDESIASNDLELIYNDINQSKCRIYVQSKDLCISDSGIIAHVSGYAIPLTGISIDQSGIFFESYQLADDNIRWRCDKCGYINFLSVRENPKCKNCGSRRYEKGN